jgi:hypothetical protein
MGRRALITLERLGELGPAELKEEWARCHGAPAPIVTPDLLRLGHRLQAAGAEAAAGSAVRPEAAAAAGGL